METFIGVIVGFLVLMLLVVLHEFGHFLAARRNGVRVLEFGIGFYPRAVAWVKDPTTHKWRRLKRSEWQKPGTAKAVGFDSAEAEDRAKASSTKRTSVTVKKARHKLVEDGMIFSLNWLPIGGFCQMDGETASDVRPGTFGAASFWSKTKILFAGVAMNWLAAFIILTVLAWTGMPSFIDNQFTVASDTRVDVRPVEVARVVEDSPAAKAGFREGDQIIRAGDIEMPTSKQINEYNTERTGKEAVYKVLRPGEPGCNCDQDMELVATLNGDDAEYKLGISMQSAQTLQYSTWSAPIVGAGLTLQMTGETFKGTAELIGKLISGAFSQLSFDGEVRENGREAISEVGDSVSGPVGIVGVLFPSFTAAGPTNLAFLAAVISISLACMNVLPIPALDGGRWLLIAIFKLRRKKLTREIEEKIVARAFVALLAMIVLVTILDITRFFR